MTTQLLVILDLNGTLADIKNKPYSGIKPDFVIHSKFVYKRPYLDEFLEFLFSTDRLQIGVWTSCIPKNAKAISDRVFKDEYRNHLQFLFTRDHCQKIPGPGFRTTKDLQMVWNLGKGWNQENTFILDDSSEKLQYQPNNLILVKPFQAGKEDVELIRIKEHLISLLSNKK
jgi:hypothetical protein